MQVLCKSTSGNAEIHCCICGQGFVLFWERESRSQRIEAMKEIQNALRRQHGNRRGAEMHPKDIFLVPEGDSSSGFAESANREHAPSWAL
jgi:hypothetical protein